MVVIAAAFFRAPEISSGVQSHGLFLFFSRTSAPVSWIFVSCFFFFCGWYEEASSCTRSAPTLRALLPPLDVLSSSTPALVYSDTSFVLVCAHLCGLACLGRYGRRLAAANSTPPPLRQSCRSSGTCWTLWSLRVLGEVTKRRSNATATRRKH